MYLLKRLDESESKTGFLRLIPSGPVLDELSYQMVIVGFLMLTIGILTGAVWAHTAWGTYWSWDPKETWSLITWLVYAALLHSRTVRGWKGKRLAIFSIIGFGCVLFTYFGVNYLPGLHSYATS
jgi:cytochrome c-type biogenesis protein CcsB